MKLKNNYYISSFFWSTLSKLISAIIGFISVPLLLGFYGKAEYGILSIATACNGYMYLLDLGMNVGSVKFFSQWKSQGDWARIYRVARTNITFYIIISFINALVLICLGIWGRNLFSISDEQFMQLQLCLIIIAIFSGFSWGNTTFNQLLIADKQIVFTMQMQCLLGVLKGVLVALIFLLKLSIITYFFLLTLLMSCLIIPYIIRCKKYNLIDSLKPATYWKDFKIVLMFSLSIFALSIFQMTAIQSRPIILSVFANQGAVTVADFKILEVIPTFILMICGTFSSIFLPKTSEMIANGDMAKINSFAYRGTAITSLIATVFCFPFILSGKEILSAYVGSEHSYLTVWLSIWLFLVLFQIHSTPANALILAKGKTFPLVIVSGISCILSIVINAVLAKYFNVGSAVIGYTVYILINLVFNYVFYYDKYLHLKRMIIFKSFFYPAALGVCMMFLVYYFCENLYIYILNERISFIVIAIVKTLMWIILYCMMLYLAQIIKFDGKKVRTFVDNE